MSKLALVYVGAVLFIIFIIFSAIVSTGNLYTLDLAVVLLSQALVPSFFITPFSFLSVVGSFELSVIFLFLILIFIKGVSRWGVIFLFSLIAMVELLGKNYIAQIAPPREFLLTNLHLGFPSGGVAHALFAYPSGHAGRTAFLSGFLLLMLILNPKIKKSIKYISIILIIVFDFFMFFSRFYLGEHWFSDVIGGMLLGFSMAFFSSYFIYRKNSK
jgi:undecaprenyl-diphosphatase